MKSWNLDPFDENREFHTEARVWTVSIGQDKHEANDAITLNQNQKAITPP